MYFASEGCCSEGFTCCALVNSSRGRLLWCRFCSKRVTDKSHRGSSQSSQPLIRKNEKKSPVFEVAALFGWLVCRCPSHLRVDPSPFTFCIYSSFTAWRERKTHHVQGLDWKILRRYSDPFTLLVQRRQTKLLGEKKKKPIKDLSWRPRPIFLSHSMVCTAEWNLNLERGPHK